MHVVVLLLLAAALGMADDAAAGALRVSIERAGIQTAQLSALPVTTETLDALPAGAAPASLPTAVGTLSLTGGASALLGNSATGGADQPSGAVGGGQYLHVGAGAAATLDVSVAAGGPGPAGYFGFWWSAADAGNTLIVNMADGDSAVLGAAAVLGADGFTSAHLGSPTDDFAGANSASPYAYVNLYAQDADSRLVSVVFRQDGGAGAFALDNFSVATGPGRRPGPERRRRARAGHAAAAGAGAGAAGVAAVGLPTGSAGCPVAPASRAGASAPPARDPRRRQPAAALG